MPITPPRHRFVETARHKGVGYALVTMASAGLGAQGNSMSGVNAERVASGCVAGRGVWRD